MAKTRVEHRERHRKEIEFAIRYATEIYGEEAALSNIRPVTHTVYLYDHHANKLILWAEFLHSQVWANHFGDFCGQQWYHYNHLTNDWCQVVVRPYVGWETIYVKAPHDDIERINPNGD